MKNEKQKEKTHTETETDRQRQINRQTDRDRAPASERERERESQRESEGEKARKKHVRHILCYKMYKTLQRMKHHIQSQSLLSFYFINKYQPFNQIFILYLRDIHNTQSDHIFTQSLNL